MPYDDIEWNFKAEEIVKSGRTSQYNIDGIRQWLNMMPTIPEMSDEQISIFLLACKNDIEATKSCIVSFFKCKAGAPELFFDRDVDGDELTHTYNVSNCAILPQRTKENYAIVAGSLKDTRYSSFNIESQVKMLYSQVDMLLCDDPPAGMVIMLDIKGVGLMHVTRLKLSTVKKFFTFLQEGLPIQLKQIHILNTSYVFDKILMVLKPFMNKDLVELIITHPPNMNMDEFCDQYYAKKALPADFGGELASLNQLTEETKVRARKMRRYLDSLEHQIEVYRDNRS